MISAGLRIKAYAYFFIGGDEKMKFFNEWFIELRVPQSFTLIAYGISLSDKRFAICDLLQAICDLR